MLHLYVVVTVCCHRQGDCVFVSVPFFVFSLVCLLRGLLKSYGRILMRFFGRDSHRDRK